MFFVSFCFQNLQKRVLKGHTDLSNSMTVNYLWRRAAWVCLFITFHSYKYILTLATECIRISHFKLFRYSQHMENVRSVLEVYTRKSCHYHCIIVYYCMFIFFLCSFNANQVLKIYWILILSFCLLVVILVFGSVGPNGMAIKLG